LIKLPIDSPRLTRRALGAGAVLSALGSSPGRAAAPDSEAADSEAESDASQTHKFDMTIEDTILTLVDKQTFRSKTRS
jgi:hypothetical protein